MEGEGLLYLYFFVLCIFQIRASRVLGPDLWKTFPNIDFVHVQDTVNSTVNVSVADFSNITKSNRDAYNAIFATLKVNETKMAVNPLLVGLNRTTIPLDHFSNTNGTLEGVFGPKDADTGLLEAWTGISWQQIMEGGFLIPLLSLVFA